MTTASTKSQTLYTEVDSPIGKLALRSNGDRLTGLFMDTPSYRATLDRLALTAAQDSDHFSEARAQLAAYFAGELRAFTIPFHVSGTPFQMLVWTELTKIPYGATISYAQLARAAGNPKAVRAVGAANGRNPLGIIIPCHRVIGADGSLTGYGGGVERKQWLLRHEHAEPLSCDNPACSSQSLF